MSRQPGDRWSRRTASSGGTAIRLISEAEAPDAMSALLDRLVVTAAKETKPWATVWAERERAGVSSRRGRRWLWGTSPTSARALVWTDSVADWGSVVGVFLGSRHRVRTTLATLFRSLDRPAQGGPVLHFSEWVPGVSAAMVRSALRPFGIRWVGRSDYRYPPGREVPRVRSVEGVRFRTVRDADERPLAKLYAEAFEDDPVEQALFRHQPDPEQDARRAIEDILRGSLGSFRRPQSFVAVAPCGVVGATLVTELHGPLITEVMVRPDFRRRGIASRLLAHSLESIRRWTDDVPRLVVTDTNRRAVRAYRSLGFVGDASAHGYVGIRKRHIRRFASAPRPRRR